MRKFLVAVALLLGIVFVFSRLTEMQAIAETLQRGDWRFIMLALGIQGVWLINLATVFRAIYRAMGMEERIERLTLLVAAANFVNVVAPSGGVGGVAVFISDARRKGYSAARVTIAGVLFVLFDYAAFILVLALGLLVLFRRQHLTSAELIASAILVGIAAVLATLIYLGLHSAEALGSALAWMARQINRLLYPFIRRAYLPEERARRFAVEGAEGLRSLRRTPENLLLPLALALSSKALLISILFLMFLAFKTPFSVGTLIAGYSIANLFLIVSPTPAGIGFVEGALTLALHSLNVPLGSAAVLALAYRGVTFWIPLLGGMAAFRWLAHEPVRQPNIS